MSDTTTTEAPVEVEPLNADATKAAIEDHLISVHGFTAPRLSGLTRGIGGRTKANLLRLHEQEHRLINLIAKHGFTMEQVYNDRLGYGPQRDALMSDMREQGLRRWPEKPTVDHVHVALPVSDEVLAAAASLTSGRDNTPIASLNASERKALKDVVDNDFSMLRSEMRAMGADMKAQRRREVEAEWAERRKAVKDFEAKARRAVDKAVKALRDLQTDATSAGVNLTVPSIHTDYIKAEAKGYEQAIRDADAEVDRELNRAELTLERQRLTAQRQVLLTGVSGEVAQQVLGSIPDAKTLMVEAAKTTTALQIDA